MTIRAILLGYAGIILYTVAPVLSVLIASAIAHALGGQLDEGNVHQILFLGIDIGRPLTVMFVCGWFALITIPSGLIMLLGFTIWWIVQMFIEKK